MISASPAHGAQAVRTQQLLSASPFPLLVRLAAPNSLAFFVQACVSMTEVWYVGRLGRDALAAMALAFPLLMLMQTVSGGAMGGAVSSAVARAIGAGRNDRAEVLGWHAIAVAIGGALVFSQRLAPAANTMPRYAVACENTAPLPQERDHPHSRAQLVPGWSLTAGHPTSPSRIPPTFRASSAMDWWSRAGSNGWSRRKTLRVLAGLRAWPRVRARP